MKITKTIIVFFICILVAVTLSACVGSQGPQGEQGIQGEAGANGENGKTPEIRVNDGWVQWKYTDSADTKWQNLYEYNSVSLNPDNNNSEGENLDNSENSTTSVKYTVTTNSSTDDYGLAGTYTMLNAKKYAAGEKVELSATVNKGYNFEGWYINNTLLSKELKYSYTMQSKNVTITAKFSSYTVNTTSSSNISGVAGTYTNLYNQRVSVGETVELVATVNEGYNFEGWYVGNICVSRALKYEYTMENKNASFEARYSCYRLTTVGVAKDAYGTTEAGFNAGTYTKYSNENLSAGKTVTLTATVNDGYNFAGWYIDGNCVSNSLEYTLTMEKSDVTVAAIYSYYTLNTTAKHSDSGDAGTTDSWVAGSYHDSFATPSLYITPIYSNQKISVGTSVTVEAKNIEGYTFYAWRTVNAILCQEKTYTFTMTAGDIELYALYVRN